MQLAAAAPKASPSLARRTLDGAIWSLAAQGISALVSLLAFALLGRMVSHGALGEYMLALVCIGAVQWLALNAWREPLVQAPTLSHATRDAVFWFSCGVACLLAMIVLGISQYLNWRGNMPITAACLPFLGIKLFFDTLASVPMALCARELRFRALARISIGTSMCSALISILMLISGFGVLAIACAQGIASILNFALTLKNCGWRPGLRFDWSDLAPLRTYSPHVILWQGVDSLNLYLDRFLAGTRLSPQALGVYGFGRRLNDIIIEVLVGAVGNVALPTYATLQDKQDKLKEAYIRSMRIMSFAVFPIIGILFAMADDLVLHVFGARWEVAVPIYRCFLLLGVIQTIGIFQAALIRSLGHARLWARYQLLQAIANIIVLYFVIDHGIFALAVAVVLRTASIWLWAVQLSCKLIAMRMRDYLGLFVKPVFSAILAGITAACTLQLMHGAPALLAMLCAALAGLLIYALAAWAAMKSVTSELLALIAQRSHTG